MSVPQLKCLKSMPQLECLDVYMPTKYLDSYVQKEMPGILCQDDRLKYLDVYACLMKISRLKYLNVYQLNHVVFINNELLDGATVDGDAAVEVAQQLAHARGRDTK